MNNIKTILIISYSSLHRDPRILKQVQSLGSDYRILTIGYTPIDNEAIKHYSINKPKRKSILRKIFLTWCSFINRSYYIIKLLESNLDLDNILNQDIDNPNGIIANDCYGLYLASILKSKYSWPAKIYFDAHEYEPRHFDKSLFWRLFRKPLVEYILKKCRKDITIMSTVCDGIAKEYERYFKFPSGFVKVITNAAEYCNCAGINKINNSKIRLIHHGGAMKARKLELMVKMMKYLDPKKYELTFMLVKSTPGYYEYLIKISKKYNIKFIDPVPYYQITNTLNVFDIGVYILKPYSFNGKYALPNKLFEFIQARLATAIGPSIEMAKILRKYNLGIASKKFTPKSLAESIAKMTPDEIMQYKTNADKHARTLSAENNIIEIKKIVDELVSVHNVDTL